MEYQMENAANTHFENMVMLSMEAPAYKLEDIWEMDYFLYKDVLQTVVGIKKRYNEAMLRNTNKPGTIG